MEKIFFKYYFEVLFSDGKTYWSYDLHDVFNYIRYCRPVNGHLKCLVQMRAEYINSVTTPCVSYHELIF